MRACVFPFDTCWLIESIRLPLFISFFSSRLVEGRGRTHFCHQQDGPGTPGEGDASLVLTGPHLIFRDRDAFALTQTPPGLLAALSVFSPVSFAKKNETLVLLVTRWPGNTEGLLKQTECRCLWCGKKGCGQKRSEQMKGWGGITSSLPTRQPWVLLLCWIECNRPGFFSLTTGACEHTSSPPWERRLSWQSQCLCLCYFRLLSLPAPHLLLCLTRSSFLVLFVLALCFFFFFPCSFSFGLIVYNTRWHYFPLFQNGMKSIWMMCSQGLLSKALNIRHLSGKILIENQGSGGDNK